MTLSNTFELTWCQPTTKDAVFWTVTHNHSMQKGKLCPDALIARLTWNALILISVVNNFHEKFNLVETLFDVHKKQNQSTMQQETHLMLLCMLVGFRVRNGTHACCWAENSGYLSWKFWLSIISSSKHALVGWRGNIPCPGQCLKEQVLIWDCASSFFCS